MGAIALGAERVIDAPPEQVFALFGAAGGLFDAKCDRLISGAPISIEVPLGRPGSDDPVQVLGWIAHLQHARKIVIEHELPWRGRLRCLFDAEGPDQTRVRLIAEIEPSGMDWLLRRRGWPVDERTNDGAHVIGLLTSKSGPGGIFAIAAEQMATLAVEQINADGGINGLSVQLLVGDDATDEIVGASEAVRLARAGCCALIGSVTSATFNRAEEALRQSGTLLIHSILNEGGPGHDRLIRLGERPEEQLRVAVGPMMKSTGGRRWFLVGEDYCWSHGAHACARRIIRSHGGQVVGESLRPLGTTDFRPVIERIQQSGVKLVLSSLVGADEVAFERQSHEMGLRASARTLALALDESTHERIGDRAVTGVTTAFGYFQQMQTDANRDLLEHYTLRYGRHAAPLSSLSESVYEAIMLYARAAHRADDPASTGRRLSSLQLDLPRGRVSLEGPTTFHQPTMALAEAVPGGYQLI